MSNSTEARIRRVLKEHGRLNRDAEQLDSHEDLYQSGLTSHASVNVMLALEGEFDIEFPDSMLNRNVFECIHSIDEAIGTLTAS